MLPRACFSSTMPHRIIDALANLRTESVLVTSTSRDSDDRIRSCRREELPEALSLWQESRGGRGKTDDHPSLTRLLDRDEDSLLVAVRGGRIVGTLIAAWDGWRGNTHRGSCLAIPAAPHVSLNAHSIWPRSVACCSLFPFFPAADLLERHASVRTSSSTLHFISDIRDLLSGRTPPAPGDVQPLPGATFRKRAPRNLRYLPDQPARAGDRVRAGRVRQRDPYTHPPPVRQA